MNKSASNSETPESSTIIDGDVLLYDPITAASQRLIMGFILFSIGVVVISINSEIASFFVPRIDSLRLEGNFNFLKSVSAISGGALILVGISFFLTYYLRYGFQLPPRRGFEFEIKDKVERSSNEELLRELSALKEKHVELLNGIESESLSLGEDEKQELIDKIHKGISDEASKEILASIEERYSIDVIIRSQLQHLAQHYNKTTGRLKQEVESLTRRGNLNLIIGSMTAILGLIILGVMVLGNDFSSSVDSKELDYFNYFTKDFMPRISLVVLIEVFAYFFLRLYSGSLDGIKYFQNELTNIESKFIGIEGAILSKESDLKKLAVENFVNTERNFVLKKGESTVDLEKRKIESTNVSTAMKSVSNIISAAKK